MDKKRNENLSRHNSDESAIADSGKPSLFRSLLAAGLILILASMAIWYLNNNPTHGWDFKNNLWIPSRLLIDGRSPYRVDLLNELGNAVWMPTIIGFGFPIGWLSFPTASNLWFLLNLAALSAIIALIALWRRPSVALVALTAVMVTAYPPGLTNLRIGQFAIIATLLLLMVALLKERLPLPVAALMIILTLSKPQLGILAVPGLLLAYYREDGPKRAFQLVGLLLLWASALTIPLFAGSVSWIGDFIAALRKNPTWAHPSLWVLMPRWFGPPGLWLWIGIVVVLGVVSLRLWLARSREEAILWSLALTPLVTPYVWSWDFVMILPLFASALMESKNRLQPAILTLGYLLCWLIVWQIMTSNPNNILYWWMPGYMVLLVLAARFAGKIVENRGAKESLKREASLPPGI